MSSPTQRTLKALRDKGYKAGVVERWLRYAGKFGKRQDLFGIIDIIAISPDKTIGIQACGGSFAEHYKKLTEEFAQASLDWLANPGRSLEIWAWRKVRRKSKAKKKKKKKKLKKKKIMSMTWKPRIVEITLEDLKCIQICRKL